MAREYRNFKLIDMAKEYLQLRGIEPRGWDITRIAEVALQGSVARTRNSSMAARESTTDFPAILANVANKTLRQGYEAYPRTFQPFCRQMTAQDFKPINRVMLADAPVLQQLNEKGEYHRAQLTDNNINYALNTYGEIVALTRKVIINDDLQAFTRVPALLGVAAARLESDTVWGIITSNPAAKYAGDKTATALFAAGHNNLLTGVASSIDSTVAGLRSAGRVGPGARRPAAAEGAAGHSSESDSAVHRRADGARNVHAPARVPDQHRLGRRDQGGAGVGAQPGAHCRAASRRRQTRPRWYLIADPAQIDTVEYCYLEGQQGVYIETKQGFEVDGIEIKARMDFGAAAIDYRGMQKNAGE